MVDPALVKSSNNKIIIYYNLYQDILTALADASINGLSMPCNEQRNGARAVERGVQWVCCPGAQFCGRGHGSPGNFVRLV